jgi:intein/homing endonuclease
MADGSKKPIGEVEVGEWIMVRGGIEQVTEVITRTNRVMYQITFMDGRILNASEDHPLYVVDKGYAAINPGIGGDYKDLGIPDMLYVGDLVLDSDGRENAIVSIETLDYPHTVYTFMESEFYANGMLVY